MAYFGDLSFVCCVLDEAYRDAHFNCRWPDLYSVQYLLRGRMYFGRDGGPRVTLTGPAIYWIDQRHTYQLGTVDRQDVRHLVNFRGPRGRRLLLDGFDLLDERGWMPVRGPGRFDDLFRVLHRTVGDPAAERHAEAVILLERLLAMLLGPAASPEGVQPHREQIDRMAREIRDRPGASPDFVSAARSLHLSYSQFRRLFQRYRHRPPHDYWLHCRMLAAAEELRRGERQVKEIAALAGYDDPAQFSRAFKTQMGVSPARFRELAG
jgi:AraC-like DNA-binding protein